MSVDTQNKIITFPRPTIEPVPEMLRAMMDYIINNSSDYLPNIQRETIPDPYVRTTFKAPFTLEWHTDYDDRNEVSVEFAASSTPPYVAEAVIRYAALPIHLHHEIETHPAHTLLHLLGMGWVERAYEGNGIEHNGIEAEVTLLEQVKPYHVARGDAGLLLHRAAHRLPDHPLTRAFYRNFAPL